MSKKIAKNYIYNGLGFPIELHNVEMVLVNGRNSPKNRCTENCRFSH